VTESSCARPGLTAFSHQEFPVTDLVPLAQAHCIPRRGHEHRLSPARIAELMPQLPGWELVEDATHKHAIALVKIFRFPDYYKTIAFVNALAYIGHREDHHADLGVHYDRCVVTFTTHDVGGLSENDFICAARAEGLMG
jgi:4a-hydroxytetrahydrobiopterin dehydratase